MRNLALLLLAGGIVLSVGSVVQATSGWYEVTFTGNDLYQFTAGPQDTATAPRRIRAQGSPEINTWTNYPGVGSWVSAHQSFGFVEFNLFGGPATVTEPWGVDWEVVGSGAGDYGYSSWKMVSAPAGWSQNSGIIQHNPSYWAYDAAPVWRLGPQKDSNQVDWTGTKYTFANHANASWTFDVLINNVENAIDQNGNIRVWFGGYDDTWSTSGYTQLAGVMTLHADAIPEPLTMAGLFLGVAGVGRYLRKRFAA